MLSPDFDQKVALITGAGAGLGRAYAHYLAARGARVVINDIDEARARETAAAIAQTGETATAVGGSVAASTTADAMVAAAVDTYGRLDILINNAGNSAAAELTRLTDDQIRSLIDVHLLGTMWVTRAALREMRRTGAGRIVNTASGVGAFGLAYTTPYGAAKAGIIGFTRSLALVVASTGIRANAIAPIACTGMSDGFFRAHPELDRERYTAEAVAPAVAYLCHDSCVLNGELLSIAAGRVARIFVGTAAGHLDPEADHVEIGRRIERIMSIDHPLVPHSALDELLLIEV